MNQEKENNIDEQELTEDLTAPADGEEIENLPVESIGSYARIEEVMTDEDSEEGSNPTAQS
jgi:hypothetical protein